MFCKINIFRKFPKTQFISFAQIFKMPVIRIDTNLKDEDIPENFEVELNKFISQLMDKPLPVSFYLRMYNEINAL